MIRTLYRHRSGTVVVDLPQEQLSSAMRDSQARLWIDMLDPSEEESRFVYHELFRFHPLAIDDATKENHVPKLDDYGNYLYMVFHTLGRGEQRMDIHTYELDVFLGATYLITRHDEERDSINACWEAGWHEHKGLARGPAFLLYELLDRHVDKYIPLLDHFEAQLENVGDLIFQQKGASTPALLDDVLTAKSSALRLHRVLAPQRQLLLRLARNEFAVVPADARIYFSDIHDHLVRLADLTESMRDLASSTIDTHLALVNNRMNEVMKVLTIISTIFIPLSFVAGIYGMNFDFMPELHWRFGYPLVWLVFITIAYLMVSMFRRRGWM